MGFYLINEFLTDEMVHQKTREEKIRDDAIIIDAQKKLKFNICAYNTSAELYL